MVAVFFSAFLRIIAWQWTTYLQLKVTLKTLIEYHENELCFSLFIVGFAIFNHSLTLWIKKHKPEYE